MRGRLMDELVKAKWVEALRNGGYIQAKGKLKSQETKGCDTEYCCLGVLMEIQDEEFTQERLEEGMPDAKFLDVMGMPMDNNGAWGVAGELAEMNDKGKTFKYIADYIELNL